VTALLHVANLFILVSFAVRDILKLRILSMCAAVAFITWFAFALEEPVWASIVWNVLFILINAWQVAHIVGERRPVALSERERRAKSLAFPGLEDRKVARLLEIAEWRDVTDEDLVTAGRLPPTLMLIVEGHAEVLKDGQPVAALFPGHFVGEVSWMSGEPPEASVAARGRVQVVEWPSKKLSETLEKNEDLRAVVTQRLGTDLARKLRAS